MLKKSDMHPYQLHMVEHLIKHSASALFVEMGLGKTVATLTAIDQLLNDYMESLKILVIAPKRVAENVWSDEIEKWEHLKHLTISKVLGTEVQRKQALRNKADIYIINRENVAWLIAYLQGAFPFNFVIIDELSSFKSAKAVRFKALRRVRPKILRVIGLTGTPAPNSLLDLWPQMYLLDLGERLGKTLTGYRDKYFQVGERNGMIAYNYVLKKDEGKLLGDGIYEKEIYAKIGDICISMKWEDYLDLPGIVYNRISVKLPKAVMQKYLAFEKSCILALEGEVISAVNAAALTTKLLQYSNGAIYGADGQYHEVHSEKLDALEEIIEVANGKPVLVFYWYRHDLARIINRFKFSKVRVTELKTSKDIQDWNEGEIPVLVAHPGSAGHGINLQAGGNIIAWFGQTWSLELREQSIARLYRQGQRSVVIVNDLVTCGTMDEDVIRALAGKNAGQKALMNAVKARIEKYR